MSNSLKTSTEGRVLIVERIFDAPRTLVFQAFSDPGHLANWWGPKGWQTEIREFDFKPGGVWYYCMKCMDKNQGEFYGQESCGKAFYEEIAAPERLVYKDTFVDSNGNRMENMPELLITMEFVEQNDKTNVITRTTFATEEALQQVKEMGIIEGVTSQYERLDEFLEKTLVDQ
ncbi:SRPBCC domain-containing protein [Fictibacillus sp. S7]|uniref:SRPBCC domain-containing protein n=1 Tax=Fictibacillus sp. S7 TaxID=2212476 RepID=UPI0010120A5D|nr:SRPBCC domain-containing protein [Fictibacillus sp. S7]RXZ02826.1 ATPase [Fictibacillus sp. S7]